MWAYKSVFYQIYPMGFCGAPNQNDGVTVPRIKKAADWVPHISKLGADAVYFTPVFESDSHGYDTRDFRKIDCRLGTNADFAAVCKAFHKADIRIVLDGVFNHVGRGFWAFEDVRKNKQASPYKDWFHISFDGNSNYNDGFWYEGWEGHYELVKLNLHNEAVVQHIFDCIAGWTEEFDIDGLRLDVAYLLDHGFLRKLRAFCDSLKPDFVLIGEMLHGDYNQIVNDEMLHSCTNYECYKGLYSSFNSLNFFEIAYSLDRQFGPEHWTLYKNKHLLCFVDNHDVSRIASQLTEEKHLPLIYALLFSMPGIPCLYYGSEWGAEGIKAPGSDDSLRPCFETPEENELTAFIAKLALLHQSHDVLTEGSYKKTALTNRQFAFKRQTEKDCIIIAINADDAPYTMHADFPGSAAKDLLTGKKVTLTNGLELPAYSVMYLQF